MRDKPSAKRLLQHFEQNYVKTCIQFKKSGWYKATKISPCKTAVSGSIVVCYRTAWREHYRINGRSFSRLHCYSISRKTTLKHFSKRRGLMNVLTRVLCQGNWFTLFFARSNGEKISSCEGKVSFIDKEVEFNCSNMMKTFESYIRYSKLDAYTNVVCRTIKILTFLLFHLSRTTRKVSIYRKYCQNSRNIKWVCRSVNLGDPLMSSGVVSRPAVFLFSFHLDCCSFIRNTYQFICRQLFEEL